MYIRSLIKLTNGKLTNIPYGNKKINKFKLDSRKINYGDVFICINSGINYVEDAIERGAIAVISEEIIRLKTDVALIKVDSIKDTLELLTSYIRHKYKNKPLIAITGSIGKTSTKELIYDILSTKYKVLKNEDNKNNYIGVSETMFNLDKTYDVIIQELGMNHAHEIDKLSMMVKPDIGIITSIGTSHIGNLGSKKNIYKAKLEILKGMRGGYLVVPPNDYYLTKIKRDNILKCYDINVRHIKINTKLEFELRYDNKEYQVKFNIPNKGYINNILIAFKTCTLFGISPNEIINKINNYKPLHNRMNIINKDNNMIIDDSYNSSYESIKWDIDYLKRTKTKKIIILGDIKELGIYSKKIHKKINNLLKKIKNKEVLLVGEEVKVIDGIHFNNNQELIEYLKNKKYNNTVILIKGSRLMYLDKIKDYFLEK